jgi:hypothetical protein
MRSPVRRRTAYYAVVLLGAIAVHQDWVATIIGDGFGSLLRRNSEAYVMMLILPAYWDLFAPSVDPDGHGATATIGPRMLPHGAWFAGLALAAIVLQSHVPGALGVDLAQALVTLGEAFVAGIVICLYLGWSRAILPGPSHVITGAAVRPAGARAVFYVAVLGLAVAVQQSWFAMVAGDDLTGWFQVNIEAYAAMLLVPAYYDLVAPSRRRWVRPAWYVCLVATPLLVQGGLLDGIVPESLLAWLGRTTEAFVAAFAISAYVDLWRGRWRDHGDLSANREVSEGARQ